MRPPSGRSRCETTRGWWLLLLLLLLLLRVSTATLGALWQQQRRGDHCHSNNSCRCAKCSGSAVCMPQRAVAAIGQDRNKGHGSVEYAKGGALEMWRCHAHDR